MSGDPSTSYSLFGRGKVPTIKGGAVARTSDAVPMGTFLTESSIPAEKFAVIVKAIAQKCQPLRAHERGAKYSETTCHAEVNFHFTCDQDGRVYIVVVAKAYPHRVAFSLLEEFQKEFEDKGHASRSLVAKEGSMKSVVSSVMAPLAKKYDDPATQDKLLKVLKSVEGLKDQMQVNITDMLANLDSAEVILEKSEDLKRQAQIFHKNAVTLNRTMWYRQFKYQVAITGAVLLAVLIVILVVLGQLGLLRSRKD